VLALLDACGSLSWLGFSWRCLSRIRWSRNKEYRFLSPILSHSGFLAAVGLADLWQDRECWNQPSRSMPILITSGCFFCVALSAFAGVRFPGWKRGSSGAIVFRDLSSDRSLCGVAILHDEWYVYGGYTYLHQNVPIYRISGKVVGFSSPETGFNVIVSSEGRQYEIPALQRRVSGRCLRLSTSRRLLGKRRGASYIEMTTSRSLNQALNRCGKTTLRYI